MPLFVVLEERFYFTSSDIFPLRFCFMSTVGIPHSNITFFKVHLFSSYYFGVFIPDLCSFLCVRNQV